MFIKIRFNNQGERTHL